MTTRILSLSLLLLAGCGTNVTPEMIEWAQRSCEENDGLDHLEIIVGPCCNDVIYATCKNTARFNGTDLFNDD